MRDGKWGKSKVQVQGKSLAGNRACGVVCEGEPVIRLETENEGYVEARQRVRGREEQQWSNSDGKGDDMEAKERGNRSKIKKER